MIAFCRLHREIRQGERLVGVAAPLNAPLQAPVASVVSRIGESETGSARARTPNAPRHNTENQLNETRASFLSNPHGSARGGEAGSSSSRSRNIDYKKRLENFFSSAN